MRSMEFIVSLSHSYFHFVLIKYKLNCKWYENFSFLLIVEMLLIYCASKYFFINSWCHIRLHLCILFFPFVGLVCMKSSSSVVELVMLLCSQVRFKYQCCVKSLLKFTGKILL